MKKYTIISIVLFVFDISAFVCALKPDVSGEYRDYYLKHTITKQDYINRAREKQPACQRPVADMGDTC